MRNDRSIDSSIRSARIVSGHKDGHLLTIDIRATATDFGEQTAWLALITDVTEQKRLEEQLRQAQKMEAVGRLAGTMLSVLFEDSKRTKFRRRFELRRPLVSTKWSAIPWELANWCVNRPLFALC